MTTEPVLAAWADRAGLHLPITGHTVVYGWADMEIGYEVDRDGAEFSFAKSDRGSTRALAWFTTQADADRMLLLQLGLDWRTSHGLPRMKVAELAANATMGQQDAAWALSWPGGTARFRQVVTARVYSGVAGLSLTALAERLQDPAAF